MKKSVLFALLSFAFLCSNAQTEQGKIFIGGQINFNSQKTSNLDSVLVTDYSNKGFQFIPNIGYFVANNFAIGINLDFGTSSSSQTYVSNSPYTSTNSTTSVTYGGGVFARYYCKIADKFFFVLNAGITYSTQPEKVTQSSNDPNSVYSYDYPANQNIQQHVTNITLAPGLTYFMTTKLGIQVNFGNLFYTNNTSKNTTITRDNHNNYQYSGVNLNSSTFNVGLNYYF